MDIAIYSPIWTRAALLLQVQGLHVAESLQSTQTIGMSDTALFVPSKWEIRAYFHVRINPYRACLKSFSNSARLNNVT
jgi:hypothetical protein